MNLRQMALEAHKAQQKQDKAQEKSRAEMFAGRATSAFVRQMELAGEIVEFTTINATTARTIGTGIVIEAREEFDAVEFFAIVECPLCQDQGYVRVASLADIGAAIENGPDCQCSTMPMGIRSIMPPLPGEKDNALASIAEELSVLNQHLSSIAATLEDARGPDGAIKIHYQGHQ